MDIKQEAAAYAKSRHLRYDGCTFEAMVDAYTAAIQSERSKVVAEIEGLLNNELEDIMMYDASDCNPAVYVRLELLKDKILTSIKNNK